MTENRSNGSGIPRGQTWPPRWLVDLIGVDYFSDVTTVLFFRIGREPAIEHVGRLTRLQRLSVFQSPFRGAGLIHLKGLTNLSELYLGDTQVGDASLSHLKGLTNLSYLSLRGTQVTDGGLAHLKGLTKLSWLDLTGTRVTDAGVAELKRALPRLMIYR